MVEQGIYPPRGVAGDDLVLAATFETLAEIRRAKSEAKKSMRAPVERVVVRDSAARIDALCRVEGDLREAGTVSTLELLEIPDADDPSVGVELAADPAPS